MSGKSGKVWWVVGVALVLVSYEAYRTWSQGRPAALGPVLISAVESGNVDVVKDLAADPRLVNWYETEYDTNDSFDYPALFRAAEFWDHSKALTMVKVLLDHGADPNLPTFNPPLNAADDAEIAKLLISKGANVNAPDVSGNTPLISHCDRGDDTWDFPTVKILLDSGAKVNAANKKGETALIVAVKRPESIKLVNLLLDHGADVNAADADGDTPLMVAASRDIQFQDVTVVQKLLARGADPHRMDKAGRTALDLVPHPKDDRVAVLGVEHERATYKKLIHTLSVAMTRRPRDPR